MAFYTKHGKEILPVQASVAETLLSRAQSEFSLPLPMISEAAGFSLSIVIRYALGLSAYEGRSFALVSESIEGCVALSGVRQLVNAGVDAGVILLDEPKKKIPWFEDSLQVLDKQGIPLVLLEPVLNTEFESLLLSCHNMIVGVGHGESTPLIASVSEMLNENATPCHSVGLPLGIFRDNRPAVDWRLFSSSTLALGVPDEIQAKNIDNLGRWYVADCSLPKPLYQELQMEAATFFAEQPVIEIIQKD